MGSTTLILLFPRCLLSAVLRNRMEVRDVGLRQSFSYVRLSFCKVELKTGFVDLRFPVLSCLLAA